MHDAEPVRLVDRDGDVAHHGDLRVERQARGRLVQWLAGDELERDVGAAGDLADLVDAADVGVVDAGLRARLAQEPQRQVRIAPRRNLIARVRSRRRSRAR